MSPAAPGDYTLDDAAREERHRSVRLGTAVGTSGPPEEEAMAKKVKRVVKPELVEVWLWDPSQKRPPFAHKTTPLEYLPADAQLPRVGDIMHLPRNVTGDTKKQAFTFGGTRTPFRVMECGHVYAREGGEKLDALDPQPAVHVKVTLYAQRLTPQEFYDDRGWEREPGV
jgi:hypothetical protein